MPFQEISEPVPGLAAFQRTDDAAVLSQAATLLLLGSQLRGDEHALLARAEAVGSGELVEVLSAGDAALFPIPRLQGTPKRLDLQRVQQSLVQRFGKQLLEVAGVAEEAKKILPEVLLDLAARLFREPTHQSAAELMEVCLQHPSELTRVAAAASYFELSTRPGRLLEVLAAGTQSDEELVRDVAATALVGIAPDHPRLRPLTEARTTPGAAGDSRTALLVHGTWARHSTWWQPGGDFHTYLRNQVRPDLYSADDRFEWSGGYSDAARLVAAEDLVAWVNDHNLDGLDLFTHSHGGNVATLATHFGLRIGELVLLSCPVHIPKYWPDFDQMGKVVSVRVHLDLVILADRGGQRFRDGRIQENVLPIWFDHSATHTPHVWIANDVPAML